MEEKNQGSVGWVLLSFLLGSIFGAALTLLMAQERGEVAREKLRKTLERSFEGVTRKAEMILEKRKKTEPPGGEEEETQT